MICPPCAGMADYVTEHGLNEGHSAEVCLDNGRDIRACGCQHRPVRVSRDPEAPAAQPVRSER